MKATVKTGPAKTGQARLLATALYCMERAREVTILCLEGGMVWGTATGLAACRVGWNGEKSIHNLILSLNITGPPEAGLGWLRVPRN